MKTRKKLAIRNYLREKSVYRKIRRQNLKKSQRNKNKKFLNNENYKNNANIKNVTYNKRLRDNNRYRRILAPEVFSFFDNSESVIEYISKINEIKNNRSIDSINLDLGEITSIDIGAISLLLSKINELSFRSCYGSLPRNQVCKKFIEDSGFLDQMINVRTRKSFERDGKNLIVNRGFHKTDNQTIGEEIKKTIEHLTGKGSRFPPLYSIIQEICSNSIEHANFETHKKNWLVATNYDTPDKVTFTLTDMGDGIIKTIRKKKLDGFLKLFKIKEEPDILFAVFNKEYTSSTSDINRNKGLPKILDVQRNGYIENLIVVSNRAYCDFSHKDKTRLLKRNFKGTFYYWEVNLQCIERWNNRLRTF